MAMGIIVGYWVVDSLVESVCNTKLPELLVVMERARAGYLERFDALILRLEREVLSLAEQLKALCLRIVCEQRFTDLRNPFKALWGQLNAVFLEFCTHCERLDIQLYDVECLVLTEDESLSLSGESDEPSLTEEEELSGREE